MRKMLTVLTTGMLASLASGAVVSINAGVGAAGASDYASKTAFCGANNAIDRESANVDSVSGFLKVLKAHPSQWNTMKKNVPSGALGTQVKKLISAVDTAESTGNTGDFISAVSGSSGGDVDSYCGVDDEGKPLPAYFNKGTKTPFCQAFLPVYEAVGDESSNQAVLAVLTAHQAQISQLASELSTLPKPVKAKASVILSNAQAAITAKNAAPVTNDHGPNAQDVALYCGQNQ
jgi:hypothetical protein